MAGSWEIKASNRVLCGILHVENVTMAWAIGFRRLIVPGPIFPVCGAPFDHARNSICQQAQNLGLEYVFFLDSDVIPPADAILRLLAHNQPIISGVYHRRSPPHGVPVAINDQGWAIIPPNSGIHEVNLVGAGCLLIHRSVLEKLPPLDERRGKRWFDWRSDMAANLPPGEALSEDFAFCLHARRNGYKILVDSNVQCKHCGLGEAGFGSFIPLNLN